MLTTSLHLLHMSISKLTELTHSDINTLQCEHSFRNFSLTLLYPHKTGLFLETFLGLEETFLKAGVMLWKAHIREQFDSRLLSFLHY